ncbi:hypothetical protein [Streptomyces reniochalinae]|uniref:hypothetical protein n=1 Tax=Streptomyces reniochalinae TaxID=2250578 RepID=UPI0015F04DB0|nr:hypothetical protein [Streptomyces reniochalinae]
MAAPAARQAAAFGHTWPLHIVKRVAALVVALAARDGRKERGSAQERDAAKER